jgi:hypothetical protein
MLAYVFWHERRADADAESYRANLAELHRRLSASALDGLIGSWTFAIDALPWRDGDGPFFEDWYVLNGSAALDRLDTAAVSGDRSPPHDRLASAVTWGTGGLYRLRSGSADGDQRAAQWFAKPAGMTYAELDALVASALSPQHAPWQRQMVLGPAPEFCLAGPALAALPAALPSRDILRELVAGSAGSSSASGK